MKKQITCIVCPRGCSMCAEITESGITVTGNGCRRGKEHAIAECTNPVRVQTSSVRVSNRPHTMVSVKTAAPIPKAQIPELMQQIHKLTVEAPIAQGQVILYNIFGTNLVTTSEIL